MNSTEKLCEDCVWFRPNFWCHHPTQTFGRSRIDGRPLGGANAEKMRAPEGICKPEAVLFKAAPTFLQKIRSYIGNYEV